MRAAERTCTIVAMPLAGLCKQMVVNRGKISGKLSFLSIVIIKPICKLVHRLLVAEIVSRSTANDRSWNGFLKN